MHIKSTIAHNYYQHSINLTRYTLNSIISNNMAKKRLFLSYDFENDRHLPGSLISQAKDPDSPFSMVDVSLKETKPDDKWVSEAQRQIQQCDFFIVLLGRHTHQASGVIREVSIARGLNKKRFQLRPKGKRNMNNKPVPDAGKVMSWKWDNISVELNKG